MSVVPPHATPQESLFVQLATSSEQPGPVQEAKYPEPAQVTEQEQPVQQVEE